MTSNEDKRHRSLPGKLRAKDQLVWFLVLLCVASCSAGVYFKSNEHVINRSQAESIALGIAVRQCTDWGNPNVNCSKVQLYGTNHQDSEGIFDGAKHWVFLYNAGEGSSSFDTRIILDRKGIERRLEELQ